MNLFSTFSGFITSAWRNEILRRYSFNVVWLGIERFVRIIVGLTVGIYVARQLGPDKYGTLSYVQNFCMIATAFGNFVADVIAVQRLVKYPERRNQILGTALIIRLCGLFLVALVSAGGILLQDCNGEVIKYIVIMSLINIWLLFAGPELYFQAEIKGKYVAISQIIAHVTSSLGRGYCAWLGLDLIYFIWFESFYAFIFVSCYVYFYCRLTHDSIFKWSFSKVEFSHLLRRSWPIVLAGIAGIIYSKSDQLFLKELVGNSEVGFYSVASRITELFYSLPTIIGITLFPAIVAAHGTTPEIYKERVRTLYSGMFYGGLFSVLFLNLVTPCLIDLLYSGKYNASIPIFQIYNWNLLFMFIAIASSKVMVIEHCQKYQLLFSIIGVVLNISMNLYLIPLYSGRGSAIASVISCGIIFMILPICFKATRSIGLHILAAPNFMPAIRSLLHWLK